MTDYYEELGVSRSASADDIKKAYRRLARAHHPDVNPGDASAEAKFKEIGKAYEVLSDPQRRARYDQFGDEAGPRSGGGFDPFGGGGLGDIFEAFLGGNTGFGGRGQSGPPRGVDQQVEVLLDLHEAAFGVQREVTVHTAVACPECSGSGCAPGTKPTTCIECRGGGQVRRVRQSILGQMVSSSPCGSCGATGQIVVSPCPRCRGEGRTTDDRKYPLDVPPGVDEGTTLRLTGRGAVGQRGGGAGDLYVQIRVRPDGRFQRDGADLHQRLEVSFAQAALGADLTIETLEGPEPYTLASGIQTGFVDRFRGKGVPLLQGRGRGDLHVHIVVETPTDLTDEQEAVLRQFAALRGEVVAQPEQSILSKIKSAFR